MPVFVAGNLLKAFSYQLEGQHILFGGNQAIYSYDCSVGEIKPLLLLQSSFPLSINYFKRVDKNRFWWWIIIKVFFGLMLRLVL